MKKKDKLIPTKEQIYEEIKLTQDAIDSAYSKFQFVIEPDLIDSAIYELNAAQLKYAHLINIYKTYN